MLWLGEQRGYLTDWITQQWVRLTGQPVDLYRETWLQGLIGNTEQIGMHYFAEVAGRTGLELCPGKGIIPDFSTLNGTTQIVERVQAGVRQFYEQTAAFDMDAWSHWSGFFRPFGALLAILFSRRLQQLNVPLTGLDTSSGITSEIVELVDPRSDKASYIAWIRQLIGSKNVLYAGSYSVCNVPHYPEPCVKVVFPLPNGNAIVLMKPIIHDDGSMTLISSGKRFGDAGFYFTVHQPDGRVYARYVRAMQEGIHVYESQTGDIRADHNMTLWGFTFLRLHYRLRLRQQHEPVPA